ncbi:MAG TPA: GAF domain-containing protein, partial [Anaerolineae bacterium]|nr:GAF domain-containing protein [Anaerolineae bacterium]
MGQLNSTTDTQLPASTAQPQRRRRDMSLRLRLTLLIFAITVPVLIAVGVVVTTLAGNNLEQDANAQLANINHTLESTLRTWLDLQTKALHQMVSQPDIVSMDAAQQKPILQVMTQVYTNTYLASTTDLNGTNVARSDNEAAKDYSGRDWFKGARNGAPVTYQTLIGATSNKPALVAAAPIYSNANQIVGVGMFASELTDIRDEVTASRFGQTGIVYVIDDKGQTVAYTDPDPELSREKLNKLLESPKRYPQAVALLQDTTGLYDSIDDKGITWRSYLTVLPNGWGIIVQQQLDELLSSLRLFRQLSAGILSIGLIVLVMLAWVIIRRALRPIGTLTETVMAMTAGDLSRAAPIEREDEIGLLARAFNTMTGRLRELIDSLETRVEMRTAQLQASAEVGRATTSILDPEQLLKQAVTLITERFGFYYASAFILDDAGQWAILREASGPGDVVQVLKQSGYKLEIGGRSMISAAVTSRQPRIALDVGAEAVRFANPLLPDTRSEIALPLIMGNQVLGALDVQSTQPAAFDANSATVLQAMADQIAVAINNATQYQREQARAEQTTALLEAALELSGQPDQLKLIEHIEQVTSSLLNADGAGLWFPLDDERLELQHTVNVGPTELTGRQLRVGEGLIGKVYSTGVIVRVADYATWAGRSGVFADAPFHSAMGVPLMWQNRVLGVLAISRSKPGQPFTFEDENLAQLLAAQAAAALDNIRLRAEQQQALAD